MTRKTMIALCLVTAASWSGPTYSASFVIKGNESIESFNERTLDVCKSAIGKPIALDNRAYLPGGNLFTLTTDKGENYICKIKSHKDAEGNADGSYNVELEKDK